MEMVYSKEIIHKVRHPSQVQDSGWEDIAENETIRLNCDSPQCNNKINPALTITRTYDGCVYNCYRCGRSGAIKTNRSPNKALSKIKELRDGRHSYVDNPNLYTLALPNDFTNLVATPHTCVSIPPQAYAWIYKYELDDKDIWDYNIGYSRKLERVIIPIYGVVGGLHTKLVAWQGRDVFYDKNVQLYEKGILKHKPLKYYTEYLKEINYNNKLYFKINLNNKFRYNLKYNKIILVEDILSAIKVSNKYRNHTVRDVVALLNSKITDKTITDLELHKYNKVYVWLDYDARINAMKYTMKLRNHGIDAKTIVTEQDPKAVPYKLMENLK